MIDRKQIDQWTRWFREVLSPAEVPEPRGPARDGAGGEHLAKASASLRALLQDRSIPPSVREALAADYAEIEALLDKLEQQQLHVAAFGRVSVGKSAVLNALAGEAVFETGVLHGTTTTAHRHAWRDDAGAHADLGPLVLIDTPGIDELHGEGREGIARDTAQRADLVLFVVDGDMTAVEHAALLQVAVPGRPALLVLNKADRYTEAEREALLHRLRQHVAGRIAADNVLAVMANPAPEKRLRTRDDGSEYVVEHPRGADVAGLRQRILELMRKEGRTFAALNAAFAAGHLSDAISERLIVLRRDAAEKLIHAYCVAKGVAVALNPVPAADLLAAAALDIALVMHLGRVYGMDPNKVEATELLKVILAQVAALMGAIWGVHLVASALKLGTAGLSTLATAGIQGALAWYATLVVGKSAERWYAQGKSWGASGPKQTIRDIVDSLDRDSVLREAREEILARVREEARRD